MAWAVIFTTCRRPGSDLDGQGSRLRLPALPQLGASEGEFGTGKTNPACGPRPPEVQRGPIDQRITGKIEGFRRILGDPIYGEILWRVARTQKANAIPNAQLQTNVAEAMERAARGIRKAHSLAESIGDTQFVSVLDRLAHRVNDNNQQSRSTQASGFGTRRTGWATSRLNAEESCSTPALSARRRHTHGADDTSRSGTCLGPFPAGCLPR